METVEKGDYYDVGDGGVYIMQVTDKDYLKVAVTDYGSITTAHPMSGKKLDNFLKSLEGAVE